ncbi:Hint domain-containing protein [Pseudorhodobacter sp. E13]|uniref:Hint domain-containing protein n=1 Tax=Pseudorhodobacter sp. E13 TaxID=2487931 RepID=UPI000F8D8565|nr:Hint domain-containing protein [Pseudorhodobacter sp. E13]
MAQVGMIYIGQFAQADTTETNWSAENPNLFLGTYSKSSLKPLTTSVTTPKNDGIAYDDDNGQTASQITYNLGSGNLTANQDSVEAYYATITLGNGTVIQTQVNVIQLTNGATFINETRDGIALDNLSIQSVKITGLATANGSGWYTTRSINNARIVCFARGTPIKTPKGFVPVEALLIGDRVLTQDHGAQPLVWRAKSRILTDERTAPIVIEPGALAPGIPTQQVALSPQHRILIAAPEVEALLGLRQVLIPAKKLLGRPGISRGAIGEVVEYHHIMCPRHAILRAGGAACESFFPGPMALAALEGPALHQLMRYFHKGGIGPDDYPLCRETLSGKALRKLLARIGPLQPGFLPQIGAA